MKNLVLLLILLFGLGTMACKSSHKAGRQTAQTSISDWSDAALLKRMETSEYRSDIVIRLERTSCFGTCPVYTTVIFSDGSGLYEGRTHSTPQGKFTFKLSEQELATLLAKASAIDYFSLKDHYDTTITDFPTTYTYVNTGKKRKQIRNDRGAPQELKDFEKLVDDISLKASRSEVK